MAVALDAGAILLAEHEERRLAVENALGSLRIEGMELEGEAKAAVDDFARGVISLEGMSERIRKYTASLV
jgi:hypothetical protein